MRKDKNQRGAAAIMVAIVIVLLLSFTALAVDLGYRHVAKNELQNVADTSALAAARQLGANYEPMNYAQQQSYVCDPAPIVATAQNIAVKNKAGGVNIAVDSADVVIGIWDGSTKVLTPTLNRPTAVKVTARRDGTTNGPVSTFFARIFGSDTMSVTADATAALTGQSTAGPGALPVPIGISRSWFTGEFCNQYIQFHPTSGTTGCAGWHTYDSKTHSTSQLTKILNGLTDGTYASPGAQAGDTLFNFSGGDLSAVLSEFENLFNTMRVKNDGVLDNDTDPNTWTTGVVVYDLECGDNPSGDTLVVGFATVTISEVLGPPPVIRGMVICENVEQGRGSGGNYGTLGSIPGLVE